MMQGCDVPRSCLILYPSKFHVFAAVVIIPVNNMHGDWDHVIPWQSSRNAIKTPRKCCNMSMDSRGSPSLVLQMLVCDSSSVSKLIYDITSSRGWDSKDGDYGRFFLPLDYSSSSIMVKCCYCYNSNISANPCRTTATPF